MNENLTLNDLLPVIIEATESGGTFKFTPNGNSMYPMLKDGKNEVVLGKAENLKVGDIPLCRKSDGNFVLHRIDEIIDKGYILRGDNQLYREGPFCDEEIICKLLGYYKNGKYISLDSGKYKRYKNIVLPLWRLSLRVKRKIELIFKGQKNGN